MYSISEKNNNFYIRLVENERNLFTITVKDENVCIFHTDLELEKLLEV